MVYCHLLKAKGIPENKKADYVIMHPDFRLIVLANRPGFPFLGNDFYRALGNYSLQVNLVNFIM